MTTSPPHLNDHLICPAVAVAIALEELDRLKALDLLPTPAALLEALQPHGEDFQLVAGVAPAYLRDHANEMAARGANGKGIHG